jgi:type II secretory pathway pseudopilin PulG
MQKVPWMMLLAALAAAALAQTPAGDRSGAVQNAQIRAGAAYSELQQAQYELKLAWQDYVNTQDAYRAAPPPANDIKRELDKMKNALDAAKTKEARARKTYDAALDAVEKAWGRPPRQ